VLKIVDCFCMIYIFQNRNLKFELYNFVLRNKYESYVIMNKQLKVFIEEKVINRKKQISSVLF
jgi:hypothetical protein